MMHGAAAVAVLAAALATAPAHAQASGEGVHSAPTRLLTLSGGVGNSHGWYGVEAEWHLARGRASVFGGAGYTPRERRDEPSGVTGSAGVRMFSPGERHRWFGELSVSQIGLERAGWVHPGGRQIYGPGGQVGYEYLAGTGLTLTLSAGLGYGIGVSDHANPWKPMLGLSCGYTWRSHRR